MKVKPFQKKTSERAYEQLNSVNGKARFLIADEVGMGKTIVASEIIHLFKQGKKSQKRFLAIYLCSSTQIASQNLERLAKSNVITKKRPTRLTLLPLEKIHEGFHIEALTPATSFASSRNPLGQKNERRFIHLVLDRICEGLVPPKDRIRLRQRQKQSAILLRGDACSIDYNDWIEFCQNADLQSKVKNLDLTYIEKVRKHLKSEKIVLSKEQCNFVNKSLRLNIPPSSNIPLLDLFEKTLPLFNEPTAISKNPQTKDIRNLLIHHLRKTFATSALSSLKPELAILDEFQNFSTYLKDTSNNSTTNSSDENALAREFMTKTEKLLLLSATPYKAPTSDFNSKISSHYDDFFSILAFLSEPNFKTKSNFIVALKNEFEDFQRVLRNPEIWVSKDTFKKAVSSKRRIEKLLSSIMSRTERQSFNPQSHADTSVNDNCVPKPWVQSGSSSDIYKNASQSLNPKPIDVRYMKLMSQISSPTHRHMAEELWRSLPYALNLIGPEYKIHEEIWSNGIQTKTLLDQYISKGKSDEQMTPDFKDLFSINLATESPNAKVRELVQQLQAEQWGSHLWVPPTIPYYKSESSQQDAPRKRLIFSSWRAVPKGLSQLISVEAERQLIERLLSENVDSKLKKNIRGLQSTGELSSLPDIKFAPGEDNEARSSFITFHSWFGLAEVVSPARLGGQSCTLKELREKTKIRILDHFTSLKIDVLNQSRKNIKNRTSLFDVLARIEAHSSYVSPDIYKTFAKSLRENQSSGLNERIKELTKSFNTTGRMRISTEDLEVIISLALGGNGVCISRAIIGLGLLKKIEPGIDLPKETVQQIGEIVTTSHSSKRMYTNPVGWLAVESVAKQKLPHWQKVLWYNVNFNIQAVLDEWLCLELMGYSGTSSVKHILGKIRTCFGIPMSSPKYYNVKGRRKPQPMSGRRHIAQAFIDSKADNSKDDDTETHHDQLRESFNSPFWPFTLITTSVGQEGLDFHRYCSEIIHWNLPANAVAFEQREGRIQRFLGFSIRMAIASKNGKYIASIGRNGIHTNPWDKIIKDLEKNQMNIDEMGMAPWWIFNDSKINRHVLCHPFSKEAIQYQRMKDSLLLYRLALGQPRNKDFLDVLERNINEAEQNGFKREDLEKKIKDLWIRLLPK